MIDYLERLFAPEEPGEGEEPERSVRFSPLEGERVEEMAYPMLAPEPEAERGGMEEKTAEFWQTEGRRRVERALSESPAPLRRLDSTGPEPMSGAAAVWEEPVPGNRESMALSRPEPRREQDELERRLRRDSRRYDSGFFWY